MSSPDLDRLDELLRRIRHAQQRPGWRKQLIAGSEYVTTLSTLRVMRAIERRTLTGRPISVRDVADSMAVEHSTASRAVANAVEEGLVRKAGGDGDQRRCRLELTDRGRIALDEITRQRRDMVAETVVGWRDAELDLLLNLLERLAVDFERRTPA